MLTKSVGPIYVPGTTGEVMTVEQASNAPGDNFFYFVDVPLGSLNHGHTTLTPHRPPRRNSMNSPGWRRTRRQHRDDAPDDHKRSPEHMDQNESMAQVTGGAEQERIMQAGNGAEGWRDWGPYVAERAWGTVREDYSADGDAWRFFPHDHARSRAYRWNEDGMAAFSDLTQTWCLGLLAVEREGPDSQRADVRTRWSRRKPRRGRQRSGISTEPRRIRGTPGATTTRRPSIRTTN